MSVARTNFELLIVGGGVTGTALLYAASRYSSLQRIGLIEKYSRLASVNSCGRQNSQTLHCGDIETNYTLEKALHVKQAADMIVNYSCRQDNPDSLVKRYPKMVLGVGDEECAVIAQRYEIFGSHYPSMQLLDASRIAEIEPKVALLNSHPRAEHIAAMGSVDDYTAVDFGALARSFVQSAQAADNKQVQVQLDTQVRSIVFIRDHFQVTTDKGKLTAGAVVVSAGGYSLLLAHQMGYGLGYSVFPMAGSFYFTPRVLNGKVYTVQNDKLPFAAIHGDPDILEGNATRFGPTALFQPLLERYNYRSMAGFFSVLKLDKDVLATMYKLMKEPVIRNYVLKNSLYEVPLLRRYLFLKAAQKIVPSLQLKDVRYARGFGGLRPQLVDRKKRELLLGEARVDAGDGIIFNMTPSPGATSCLQNARTDLTSVCRYLGEEFEDGQFTEELCGGDAIAQRYQNSNTCAAQNETPKELPIVE